MHFSTTIFLASLAVLAVAKWDKYAEDRAEPVQSSEPASQDAEWQQSHGGAAPTYAATVDWLKDAITSALGPAVDAVQSDVPPLPTLNIATDAAGFAGRDSEEHFDAPLERRDEVVESDEWAKENGYTPLSRRDAASPNEDVDGEAPAVAESLGKRDDVPDAAEPTDVPTYPPLNERDLTLDPESEEFATANGYAPLAKREAGIDPESAEFDVEDGYAPLGNRDAAIDPESAEFAAANGYAPLGKRDAIDDPDTDEFAIANGYAPLTKRGAGEDPSSDEFALANGYVPLSRRSGTEASQTTGNGLLNWFKDLGGRNPRPAQVRE